MCYVQKVALTEISVISSDVVRYHALFGRKEHFNKPILWSTPLLTSSQEVMLNSDTLGRLYIEK